ncbi:MAG TPA: Gfo/Idh/MocA family oxidoreductase [Anaerolineae bacterium]|nr:Gfo/Idh/MocA family oxidoreductase [Anaerolineae bacterium]
MPVRAGVIGIGVHGLHHVRVLSEMEDVELSGIYDINQTVSKRVASQFGTIGYDTLEKLLNNVDCVTVAVPTLYHCDVVIECLSKGKSVLVEKPIASHVAEADRMITEAEKRRLVLSVGHIERFNSAYRTIPSNNVSPVFIESHRLSEFNPRGTDVAVVLDLMIHDIDIVLNMVKRPILTVNAIGVSVVSNEVDISNARLEFKGGCVANLTASRISQRKMRKIRTFQKYSYISMDFLSGESEVFTMNPDIRPVAQPGLVPQLMDGIIYKKFTNDGLNALKLEISDFIQSVKHNSKPQVTGHDGRKALQVASMVMESMEVSMRRIE